MLCVYVRAHTRVCVCMRAYVCVCKTGMEGVEGMETPRHSLL